MWQGIDTRSPRLENFIIWVELMWRYRGFCHVLRGKSYLKKSLSTWQNPPFFNTSSTRAVKVINLGRFGGPNLLLQCVMYNHSLEMVNSKIPAVKVERLKKTSVLVLKPRFFLNVQLWRLVEADPVGVQRFTVCNFKDLFKIFKMTYSMSLYSDGIIFKFRFQKSRFTAKTP